VAQIWHLSESFRLLYWKRQYAEENLCNGRVSVRLSVRQSHHFYIGRRWISYDVNVLLFFKIIVQFDILAKVIYVIKMTKINNFAASAKRSLSAVSVCLSRRLIAAAACSWFAAEVGRRWPISINSCKRPGCGNVVLRSDVRG